MVSAAVLVNDRVAMQWMGFSMILKILGMCRMKLVYESGSSGIHMMICWSGWSASGYCGGSVGPCKMSWISLVSRVGSSPVVALVVRSVVWSASASRTKSHHARAPVTF